MKQYSYKYGFLTTYERTVFFKQEPLVFRGEMARANDIGKSILKKPSQLLLANLADHLFDVADGTTMNILWYSDAILHETAFSQCVPPRSTNPLAYKGRVSLRECMFFLMMEVSIPGNYVCPNRDSRWTKVRLPFRVLPSSNLLRQVN